MQVTRLLRSVSACPRLLSFESQQAWLKGPLDMTKNYSFVKINRPAVPLVNPRWSASLRKTPIAFFSSFEIALNKMFEVG